MINIQEIIQSHKRIAPYIHRTPVLTNQSLNYLTGTKLFCKCENFQKTGAFKIRGATNAIEQLSEKELSRGIATASSGNHGAALAFAASRKGIESTIIMPKDSSIKKIENVKRNGGKIIWCEPVQESRESMLEKFVRETNSLVIPPYNDERIIIGQGTAALELLEDQPDLDVIITPVSGGGLLSGTLCTAKKIKSTIEVYGAEPEEADDAYRSIKAGIRLSNETTNTICDGLRAQIGEINFPIIKKLVNGIITLSEEEIIQSMRLVWERMKILIEPSSSIVLAAVLKNKKKFINKNIGLIFSGGNVDIDDLPW